MKKAILALLCVCSFHAYADNADFLNVAAGAYKQSGNKMFIAELFKNSPMLKEKAMMASVESALSQEETLCGRFKDFDIMKQINLTPKVNNIYLVLNYETCPLYVIVTRYKTADSTITSSFTFEPAQKNIFPFALFDK